MIYFSISYRHILSERPTSDEDYIPIKSKLFCYDKLSVKNFNQSMTAILIIYFYQNGMVMYLWDKFNFGLDNMFVSWIGLMVVFILMCIPHWLVMYGRKEKKLWTFKMYFGIFGVVLTSLYLFSIVQLFYHIFLLTKTSKTDCSAKEKAWKDSREPKNDFSPLYKLYDPKPLDNYMECRREEIVRFEIQRNIMLATLIIFINVALTQFMYLLYLVYKHVKKTREAGNPPSYDEVKKLNKN